jgi:elongation factor Ts
LPASGGRGGEPAGHPARTGVDDNETENENEAVTAQITAAAVKALREETGAGIMDCKRALEDSAGDVAKAKALLREKGLASGAKKADRATDQGTVESYIHSSGGVGRIGALVEVNCETDFVARTDEFKHLAREIARQVVAMNPRFITAEEAPADVVAAEGLTPDEVAAASLLTQPYVRDNAQTIAQLIAEAVAKTGENIRVRRFARFELGR